MVIKKSELYSSLWKSCDELRGGMDAGQYKDYVLVLLFVKYVSDKYAGDKESPIEIPDGASFNDLVRLKGQPNIGERFNQIIKKIADANRLNGVIDVANFSDEDKLGRGKEMVDRLSNLIAIFENPALNFSSNRAENDDLLGDAYEYLMRHFATESGKSKGQFYTPAEVSRIIAKVIGANKSESSADTIYDPTCGSGSLLLKAADETPYGITIYGQENDNATRALAVMNMWLHSNPASDIRQGNTIASPHFIDDQTGELKTFDFVVANPPFSYKSWSNGIDPANDAYDRFNDYGIPPVKNGDYAFLLHILKSLKPRGKGACILPHGVLFRGKTEADIRRSIIRKGYIKGIIGLPANLFYGTGIPACIIVIDKENADTRGAIFMVDASAGFIKDGNKNRLREQDIHKIVDVFTRQIEIPGYSQLVFLSEIQRNDYNLNIPRYINHHEPADIQDIGAHLKGDIPAQDIDNLNAYWKVYPSLKSTLFQTIARPGYWELAVRPSDITRTIYQHPEFTAYGRIMRHAFEEWKTQAMNTLKNLEKGCHPKQVIHGIAENILKVYRNIRLIDEYDVYQHLLNYYMEIMQDDLYEISADGWEAGRDVTRRFRDLKKGKKEVEGIDGLEGRLIPPLLIVDTYFRPEKEAIDALNSHKKMKLDKNAEAELSRAIRKAWNLLEIKVLETYPTLSIDAIQALVIERKWMDAIAHAVHSENQRIGQRLAGRIKQLAERYAVPLSRIQSDVDELEQKVNAHLSRMGIGQHDRN
ncbi:MAG: N-6 DNA methylase [Candidatus Omnitrophota bacterium]